MIKMYYIYVLITVDLAVVVLAEVAVAARLAFSALALSPDQRG